MEAEGVKFRTGVEVGIDITADDLRPIVQIQLQHLKDRLAARRITLVVTDAAATKVEVHTLADSSTVPDYHQMLATCEPSGTVRWYRGTIRALNDQTGANRTVNELPLEQYLRTVIAMEMSPGWASAGGGKGAQALQAQAVAARSYALSYRWYPYADVCDMTC